MSSKFDPSKFGVEATGAITEYASLVKQILGALDSEVPALKSAGQSLFEKLKRGDLLTADDAEDLIVRQDERSKTIAGA